MDSFEFNKYAMSGLGAIFIVMALNFGAEGLFHSEAPEEQGYAIEVTETSSSGDSGGDTGPAYEPINALLASADIGAGEKVAKKCATCHSFEEGGPNKVGPGLYDIVNKQIAATDGFGYSGALTEYGAGKTWTYEELNGFLWKPKTYVKGTAMGFAGLKKVEERANIVAYLRSLAGTPEPLPSAEPAPEAETTSASGTADTEKPAAQ